MAFGRLRHQISSGLPFAITQLNSNGTGTEEG
jgi:hypothetical protein